MALDATKLFYNELPLEMRLKGKVNGREFTIEAKGTGYSKEGSVKGKFVCTSGKCPVAWQALSPTFGYGFKCFTKMPNGISHWYQQTMPQGYTQERTFEWENDGTFKVYQEVSFHNGVIFNNVTLEGEGFRADSPVLNDGLKTILNSVERVVPTGKGLETASVHFYPLKGKENQFVQCNMSTVHRALDKNKETLPAQPFFTRNQNVLMKDSDDNSDHIILHEILQGHDFAYENN